MHTRFPVHAKRLICSLAWLHLLSISAMPQSSPEEWSKWTRLFQKAVAEGNEPLIGECARALVADNSSRAMELLLKPLPKLSAKAYWSIIASLSGVTSEPALEVIVGEVLDQKKKSPEVRRDLIMALRFNTSAIGVTSLGRILRDGSPDLQVAALDELVDKNHLPAIPIAIRLVEDDQKSERELTRRVLKAMQLLVKEIPQGPPPTWREWWESKTSKSEGQQPTVPSLRKPGTTVAETIRLTRMTQYEDLKRGKKETVVVVSGEFDKVEDALSTLGIEHRTITPEQFHREDDLSIGTAMVVFVNCGVGDISTKQAERLRKYVESGGSLFATDLAIPSVINRAFPGFLTLGKGALTDMVIEILPARGVTGHILLRGVDLPLPQASGEAKPLKWTVDSGGPLLAFDATRAIALIDSPDLQRRKKPSTVALTFTCGGDPRATLGSIATGGVYEDSVKVGGRVVCVLSHFIKQRTNDDGFILENLLVNLLIEANDRRILRSNMSGSKR